MPDSSDDHLPISEEPTQDVPLAGGGSSQDDDSMEFGFSNADSGDNDVPKQIGDYEIRHLIGSGGMGNVYLAQHIRMERIVAIKMLPIERMNNAEAVRRFYAEVRAASRLLHPNIVTAFDAGQVDAGEFGNIHYLAMEYVDGMTLTQAVARGGPMSVGEAAAAIRQAALGLLHAHRAGIVHRDVKPGNLMRAKDGTVKVLDLGLARINSSVLALDPNNANGRSGEDSTSQRGRLVGTLAFMSPEQLEDPDSADTRSDIYSLGATLYFLLTATPPYVGEYLDQVYGHRHGDIPDLMQARGDIDLHFANIFSRMMAKSPSERYESLDEVIDALGDYASESDSPSWLFEFTQRQTGTDASTVSGGSTSGATARVLGIDLGMFYSAAAEASPSGETHSLAAGQDDRKLFRMAIASDGDKLLFDQAAITRRAQFPQSIAHCLPLYIGQTIVARNFAGRKCPPEVLMAMVLRQIFSQSWENTVPPHATAIAIPSSYDQLHRRSIMQAAQMAGFASIRLVDRSIAGVHSLWIDDETSITNTANDTNSGEQPSGPSPTNSPQPNQPLTGNSTSKKLTLRGHDTITDASEQNVLFIGVSGQATEVAIIRGEPNRLQQIATAGHWHGGTLPWLQRLVDLANEAFGKHYSINPKKNINTAASLQIACEKAMNSMLLMPSAKIEIEAAGTKKTVQIERVDWIAHCSDLIDQVRIAIERACVDAKLSLHKVDRCVTLGAILRLPSVRDELLQGLRKKVEISPIDRSDVARGAAACLAAELPGRGDIAFPPRGVTSQTIGIVVEDAKGRRRILPIIPAGTALPARTNRRLKVSGSRTSMKVALVESSGVDRDDWQSLGRYEIEVGSTDEAKRTRTISFEVNVNGLLTVRAPMPIAKASGSSAQAIHQVTDTA